MTKLIVAFRNFANAPKYILMRLEIGTVVEHRIYDDTCVPYNHETELLCYYLLPYITPTSSVCSRNCYGSNTVLFPVIMMA